MKFPVAASLLAALVLTAPVTGHAANRGSVPERQPVVQRTDYLFDADLDANGTFSPAEQRRMIDWFDAIGLGYGDRVSLVRSPVGRIAWTSDAVARLIARYGLLLATEAPATVGDAPANAVRIVVSRASATVPGCPDWSDHAEADYSGGLSRNYGCAVNGNLAAMVADSNDLVEGRSTRSSLTGAMSDRAIKAYRDATPSGGGGGKLK